MPKLSEFGEKILCGWALSQPRSASWGVSELSPRCYLFWYFVPAILAVIMTLSITDGISDSDCTLLTIKHPIEKWKCWVINIV